MPLSRFNRLPPDRRQRLLAAAAREFANVGFDSAALGRIADDAGVSKPALYYYFEDKVDLYATVVREAWQRLSPVGTIDLSRLGPGDFWPALEAFHTSAFENFRMEPWLLAVWKLAYHPPPQGAAAGAVAAVFEEAAAFLRALFRRGCELGVVRTDLPEDLLTAMFVAADNAADHWLADRVDALEPETIHDLSRRVFETTRRLLAPPATGG